MKYRNVLSLQGGSVPSSKLRSVPSSKGGSDPFPKDALSDEGNVPSLKDGIVLFPKDTSMEEGNVPYSKDVSPEEGEWKPVVKRGGLRREGGWRLPI